MENVISVCKVSKRDNGDNHWFWAVWIDVDHKGQLPDQEPNERGFASSKPYREISTPNGDWTDYLQRTFVLDRVELESTGKVDRRRHGWGRETYCAHPDIYFAERRSLSRPDCFVAFGVPADATEADVKSAFKMLAKRIGGDPEEFKAVYAAYERAMEIVSSKV